MKVNKAEIGIKTMQEQSGIGLIGGYREIRRRTERKWKNRIFVGFQVRGFCQ